MIKSIINCIDNKDDNLIIVDIGTSDSSHSVEFYKHFPNSKIYLYECNPNTLDICRKNIEPYSDRIILIEDTSYINNIDVCFINNNDFTFILNKIPLRNIKLLFNNHKILYDNLSSNLEMYCVYHKNCYIREDNYYFTFFGVNETYPKERKTHTILEYELNIYNPFLQKRGYMETSAYLHVYWNKLYKNKEMVGFSQYDMKHNTIYNNLDKNTLYILNTNTSIVNNGEWNSSMLPQLRNLEFILTSYNNHFNKTYTINDLENKPLSLWQTNIYPVKTYEKLCTWLEKFVEEIYPWSNQPPYEIHFGSIGGYTERALSIFNAFEIFEGIPYSNLDISHGIGADVKEQYNQRSFLNNYSQDIHTTYIDNITGKHSSNFCMFNAECYLDKIKYSCERVNINNKNGLYFMKSGWDSPRQHAFDIEGEDPRIFIINNQVYIIFICLSPYIGQNRCIGITPFEQWQPIFLQIENMKHNLIEKNWAPFVKDNKLYFVYNYDPLVIIQYDFNPSGICNVVYKQDNVSLPIDTSTTFLRGGSNLIKYKDDYYIGGCHSRIHKKCYQHYTNIILLDTNNWKLIYLSKPVMYYYSMNVNLNAWHVNYRPSVKYIDKIHNILNDTTPNIIQDPISLYMKDNKYYITINVRDCVSLLYEIQFNKLLDLKEDDIKSIGYWDLKTKCYSDNVN
jgi:hypothetical protein